MSLRSRLDKIEMQINSPDSRRNDELAERIRKARERCGLPDMVPLSPEEERQIDGLGLAGNLSFFRNRQKAAKSVRTIDHGGK